MSDFNNYKLFKNVGIRSSDNKLIVMNVNKSNNVSFYSSDGGTNNIDVMSINSIINKSQNEDLNLSSLTGTTINPVITINNNHGDCRIKTNLNVEGNLNINKIAINGSLGNSGDVLKSTGNGLEWGTGGTAIDLSSSTGIGTKLISGDQLILGNSPISMNLNFSGINLHINGNIPTTAGQVLKTNANNDGFEWGAGLADVSGETDFGSRATQMVTIGNNNVGLNLNFSGNNLHINGNVPKAGQVLVGTGSEVKWADTDYTFAGNNQLLKVITETVGIHGEFKAIPAPEYLHLNSGVPNYTETYIAHDAYTLNQDTKKVIIIINFTVYDSNLVSKIKLELWVGGTNRKEIIFKNMTGNQINDFVKYFTITKDQFGTGSKEIKFVFTDLNNSGTIKIFTKNGSDPVPNPDPPTITLQEIGDKNIRTILDETRGSKTDQIAKVLVNTNPTESKQLLDINQSPHYEYTHLLNNSYTPSVSDTGTIIIIVNFATYISFNNNLTSKLKLELLLNNGSDTTIPQERTKILQEMNSNRSYEYTKYFSISKSVFGTSKKIELRFTDMNNLGNITLFTNDNSNVKQPTVTIQEIGSTTGWGSTIENIPIGQTTSADGSFNKMVVKHNLDVSGNLNIIGTGIINTSLGIGTTSLNNGFTGSNVHTNSILDINGQTTIRGHILPSQNAQFDLGNAEYKIRHLFLSDNSLWIGDKHKIDVTDGTIKFRKRKTKTIPTSIDAIKGGDDDAAIQTWVKNEFEHGSLPAISAIKLEEWHAYAQSKQANIKIEDIFKPGIEGDWDENDTTMDKLVIKNNIDVSGNLNITTFQPNVSSGISITNRSKKRWGIRVNGVSDTASYLTDGAPDQNLDKYGGVRKYAAYYNDSHMARYLGMTQTALDSAKTAQTAIDVDVYNSDGVFIRQDTIKMDDTFENTGNTVRWPVLRNSTDSAVWKYDEYIRGRNINPIGSYVGIGTTNSEYELSVHGQVHILGTGHQRNGFGGKEFWPLKITLDGNPETNMSVPYNGGSPNASNWVGMGAAHGNGSGWWSDRNPIQWQSGPKATVVTGLDALYFTTKGTQATGKVEATAQSYTNILSFTGQHRNVPNNIDLYNNIDNYIGYIVYSTGNYKTYNYDEETLKTDKNAITINDSLPEIALSNKKQQKSVFGVLSNKEEEERHLSIGNFHTPYPNINDNKRLYVNSMGEGAIWIVNTNGNLENGDYIQSSDVIGMGEKQDSEFLANYTVAKITCDCNFELNTDNYECIEFIDPTSGNTYKKAFVGCTYHCG